MIVPVAHPSPRAHRKGVARRMLEEFDRDAMATWTAGEPQAIRLLQSFLFDPDELVRWRAVEAIGRAASVRARAGLEPVRELLRRTLWLMNDESGGLLWHGPQVLAAVMGNVPALCDEFGVILGSFLEEEPFRAGTRWALWRLAPTRPELVASHAVELEASLTDPEPAVRGHAALALGATRGGGLAELARDAALFTVFDYRSGDLRTMTVAQAASGAW
jgi:HEAT repeat protein